MLPVWQPLNYFLERLVQVCFIMWPCYHKTVWDRQDMVILKSWPPDLMPKEAGKPREIRGINPSLRVYNTSPLHREAEQSF